MEATRDDYIKWRKPGAERQVLHAVIHTWNLTHPTSKNVVSRHLKQEKEKDGECLPMGAMLWIDRNRKLWCIRRGRGVIIGMIGHHILLEGWRQYFECLHSEEIINSKEIEDSSSQTARGNGKRSYTWSLPLSHLKMRCKVLVLEQHGKALENGMKQWNKTERQVLTLLPIYTPGSQQRHQEQAWEKAVLIASLAGAAPHLCAE